MRESKTKTVFKSAKFAFIAVFIVSFIVFLRAPNFLGIILISAATVATVKRFGFILFLCSLVYNFLKRASQPKNKLIEKSHQNLHILCVPVQWNSLFVGLQKLKSSADKAKESRTYKKAYSKAEGYLNSPEKLEKLLSSAKRKANRRHGPLAEVWEFLTTSFRMLKSFTKGEYREIPWQSLTLIVVSIIYFVSPIDAIPDFLTGVGLLDDVGLIAWTMKAVASDIDAFCQWEVVKESPSPDQAYGYDFTAKTLRINSLSKAYTADLERNLCLASTEKRYVVN